MDLTRYETDVLVIGGGGAATAATIAAHEGGARTALGVKGQFGAVGARGAGATSNPIGDYWTIRTVGPKGGFFNPPEQVHADMVQAGLGMADPELCSIFVDEVSDAIRRLKEMGMKFASGALAIMEGKTGKGGTNNIVAIQKAIIEHTGTQVIEHANFTDLLVKDGRCVGAVGVDDSGKPFVVEAGAVVLATGGVGQLFKYSFNPPGNTGDGYAMALRAGAELFNMEFMQQGIATTAPTQVMVMLYEMEEPYRLTNAKGETFVENYLPPGVTLEEVSALKANHWPVTTRDSALHLDRAIKGEAMAGRATETGGVFVDLTRADRGFQPELFVEFMVANGFDVKNEPIQIQVHHHTSNGGLRIDSDAQSTLPGLFAAGEVAGWQGADRLGGTMLGGSQVFGSRAGKAAAATAASTDRYVSKDMIDSALSTIADLAAATGPVRPTDRRIALQTAMWESLIVEKDAQTLERARSFVRGEREKMESEFGIGEPMDVALLFEHRNLLDVAEAIIEAASLRTESRGSHYRNDFPERNDTDWMTNILISRQHDQLTLRKEWLSRKTGWQDRPGDIRIKPWG